MSETSNATSLSVTLARIGAVIMAIAVVSYLVWQAQSSADRRAEERNVPVEQPTNDPVSDPANDPAAGDIVLSEEEMKELLMSSSKSRVISPDELNLLPSSKFAPLEPLPSSKSLVIEPDHLLYSSKSGRPINPDIIVVPDPEATPQAEKPQPEKPQATQTGTGGN